MEALITRSRSARLLCATLAIAGSFGASTFAQEPTWPLANGSHDILHSFQHPFSFSLYFHEGVDIRGNDHDVVAMRGGTVRYVNQGNAGGTLLLQATTPMGSEYDSYLHVNLDPWLVGDVIQAGDRVGRVSTTYFATTIQHHVHVNRFKTWPGGDGYVTGRTNMLNPLAIFSLASNRDPQQLPAQPSDANFDGFIFHVSPSGTPTTRLPFAYSSVELLLEATDRQTQTLSWNQGVLSVGYWVQSLAGGESVASPAQPYRLLRFDDAWRSSSTNCDTLVSTAMITDPAYRVAYGAQDTGWYSLATYRLTRTSGFTGLASSISAAQSWKTDARLNSGSPNGTGATTAREIHEARFPDGSYVVHGLITDWAGETDSPFSVVVDNYRPYVQSFQIIRAASGLELYRGEWKFDAPTGTLQFVETFARNPFRLRVGETIAVGVTFSEPMASAALASIEPAIGVLPVLTSSPIPTQRTRWIGTFVVQSIPLDPPHARVRISGTDLAGTTLFPLDTGATRTAPFNKRVNALPITTPTVERLFRIPFQHDASAH